MAFDSFVRNRQVLTPLVPLVDKRFLRGEMMKARGWHSFEPYWKFRQTLCSSNEWHVHEKIFNELTKERLGNYHSDFLAELRTKNSDFDFGYLTECDRAFENIQKNWKAYEAAWQPFEREQIRLREHEIELHATNISRERHEDDEQLKRLSIWTEVVHDLGQTLGLKTKSKVLGRNSPIFRCKLTDEWHFALGVDVRGLGVETADKIAKPQGMGPLPIGAHITWKALVPANKSKVNIGDQDLIFVPQVFFPLDNAYYTFWNLEGLEINVRAEMTALELIWDELKSSLIEGVSSR